MSLQGCQGTCVCSDMWTFCVELLHCSNHKSKGDCCRHIFLGTSYAMFVAWLAWVEWVAPCCIDDAVKWRSGAWKCKELEMGHCISGWREAKKSNREEKEKSEFPFPIFEKRKRNLKTISLISRGERESWIPFPQFREEKEKFENNFSYFERRERKLNFLSPVSRREREIRQIFSTFEKRKRKVK